LLPKTANPWILVILIQLQRAKKIAQWERTIKKAEQAIACPAAVNFCDGGSLNKVGQALACPAAINFSDWKEPLKKPGKLKFARPPT
jgi:hypothetical protein